MQHEDRRGRRWPDRDTWYPIFYWALDRPGSHRKTRLVQERQQQDGHPMPGSFLLATGAPVAGFAVVRRSARPVRAALPGVWVLPDAAMGADTAFDRQTRDRGEADQLGETITCLALALNVDVDQADVALLDHVLAGTVRLLAADIPGVGPQIHAERSDWPGEQVRLRTEDHHRVDRLVDDLGLLTLGGADGEPARPYRLTAAGAALRAYAHRGDEPTPEATP